MSERGLVVSGITNPAEAFFKDGAWGWDSTQWRKLSMLWGYSDTYSQGRSDTSSPAGLLQLDFSVVPAGEVWHIYGMSFYFISATCSEIRVLAYIGGGGTYVDVERSPTSGFLYAFHFNVVLKAGDYLVAWFNTMTLNDDGYAWAWGYKMKVAE